eukprot:3161925-Pyramimonas_sp.AAC.1
MSEGFKPMYRDTRLILHWEELLQVLFINRTVQLHTYNVDYGKRAGGAGAQCTSPARDVTGLGRGVLTASWGCYQFNGGVATCIGCYDRGVMIRVVPMGVLPASWGCCDIFMGVLRHVLGVAMWLQWGCYQLHGGVGDRVKVLEGLLHHLLEGDQVANLGVDAWVRPGNEVVAVHEPLRGHHLLPVVRAVGLHGGGDVRLEPRRVLARHLR